QPPVRTCRTRRRRRRHRSRSTSSDPEARVTIASSRTEAADIASAGASSIAVCIAAASGALRRIATAAEASMIIRQTVRVVQIVLADPQMWCRRDFVLQAGDLLTFRLALLAHPCQIVLERLPDRGGRARAAESGQLPGEGRDSRILDVHRCHSRILPWVVESGR